MIQMNSCERRGGPLKDVTVETAANLLISYIVLNDKKQPTKILSSYYTDIHFGVFFFFFLNASFFFFN